MKITIYSFLNKNITQSHLLNGLCALMFLFSFNLLAEELSLNDAEQIAIQSDPAQQIYQAQQNALIAEGKAGATLADPMIKLGVANLPVDSFKLDEEPMTQLSIGLSQQFSRGNELELTQKGFNQQSELAVLQGLDRQLLVKKEIQQLWFNILFVEKSSLIIKENKLLFTSFYSDLEAKFSLGMVDNEDLIAAEIELNRFDEKLASLTQQSLNYRNLLSEWVGSKAYNKLQTEIPSWAKTKSYIDSNNNDNYMLLSKHPKVAMLAQKIAVADNSIELAEQGYKPSFKVDVGYGLRLSEDDVGNSRTDLLSAFISMDIPLFTDKRQDQKLISAQQFKGQKQAEHHLLLRRLNAELNAEISNYQQLKARQMRYKESLLKQAKLHVKLLEQSYQSNTRSFKSVIDAYIHQQNLSLEYQQLYFDGLKSLSNIRYFQAI
jgi:outer membrane protein TolC